MPDTKPAVTKTTAYQVDQEGLRGCIEFFGGGSRVVATLYTTRAQIKIDGNFKEARQQIADALSFISTLKP